jgi:F-type H+-transporting ATPase subunit b
VQEIFEEVSRIIDAGLNSVTTNPDIVLLNLLALVVLALFVRKFFWVKITSYLEKQQEALTSALKTADAEKAAAIKLQQDAKKDYQNMKKETEALKQTLTKQAKAEAELLISKAQDEASFKIKQAQQQMEFERKQLENDIKTSITEVAFSAAKKIVAHEIDEKKHKKLIDEAIKEGLNHESR